MLTGCGALATIGSLLLASNCVNAQEYSDLPDGVVHFPLTRVSEKSSEVVYKRDSNNNTVSSTLTNEIFYFSTDLQIGSNEQTVSVRISTCDSDLCIMNASNPYCSGSTGSNVSSSERIYCPSNLLFDSSSSSTFHSNETDTSEEIDRNFMNGTYATDTIIINGQKISEGNFILATSSNYSANIFGIGLQNGEDSVEIFDPYGFDTPVYNNIPMQMRDQGLISEVAYSIWLNRQDSKYGSLLFGGVDHAKYQGSLLKVPVISPFVEFRDQTVIVALGNLTLYQGGESLVVGNMCVPAIVDTSSAFTELDKEVFNATLTSIGGVYEGGNTLVPCDLTGGLTFDIGGIEIEVPFAEMMTAFDGNVCILGIRPAGNYAILGDSFLRNVYSVYDLQNLEIAFAPAVFDSSDSNVEPITFGIPSAGRAPRYHERLRTDIFTQVATFYETGSAGKKYGEYPSNYTGIIPTSVPAPAETSNSSTTSLNGAVTSTVTRATESSSVNIITSISSTNDMESTNTNDTDSTSTNDTETTNTHDTETTSTHDTETTSTHSTETTSTSATTTSTSSASKSKNGAGRNGAGVGILGSLAGCLLMLF